MVDPLCFGRIRSELEIAQGGVAAEVAESTVDSLLDFVNPNLATQGLCRKGVR